MTNKEKKLQAEAIGYYRKRIAELEMTDGILRNFSNEQATCIERLEKENKELEKACEETQELLDKQIEATYKLDKENAELKDDNKVMADNYSIMEQKFYDNLTKAKEIIKKLISLNRKEWIYSDVREEAEQFLNEVEK